MTVSVEVEMRAAHAQEIIEIIDTDELVRSRVAALIEELTTHGRSLGYDAKGKHRYSALIDEIGSAMHDGMPAPREFGDDPFMC